MFDIHYLKSGPTDYVLHYQNGRLRKAGAGLAFFYYRPAASIAVVPVGSADIPFIFNETSADFQSLTLQGQLTYHISDPQRVASLLNYTVASWPGAYLSDDPEKLSQRLVNLLQVLVREEIQHMPLRQAIHASQAVSMAVLARLHGHEALSALGVAVLELAIQSIRPNPEMARALEAEAREALLGKADAAIYDRRNAAVEQERRIKENELNTEIAVEEKKRRIREAKVEADLAVEAREQQVREAKLEGQVRLEEERKRLVALHSDNFRSEADDQAYALEASLRPRQALAANLFEALSLQTAEPGRMVSSALKELAHNAAKIGSLHISPELLETLLRKE